MLCTISLNKLPSSMLLERIKYINAGRCFAQLAKTSIVWIINHLIKHLPYVIARHKVAFGNN